MSRSENIEKGLARVETLAQQLLQASYETRALIKEEDVSTPPNNQPVSEQELAAVSARRRQRLNLRSGK